MCEPCRTSAAISVTSDQTNRFANAASYPIHSHSLATIVTSKYHIQMLQHQNSPNACLSIKSGTKLHGVTRHSTAIFILTHPTLTKRDHSVPFFHTVPLLIKPSVDRLSSLVRMYVGINNHSRRLAQK